MNQSFEVLLEGSNQLNRKLEESIAVGQEFAPIAGLWSQLDVIMRSAGIPDLAAKVKEDSRRAASQGAAGQTSSLLGATTTTGAANSAGAGARAGTTTPTPATPSQVRSTPITPGGTTETPRPEHSNRASLRASMGLEGDGPTNKLINQDEDLPPGVAPGGGIVYGRDQ